MAAGLSTATDTQGQEFLPLGPGRHRMQFVMGMPVFIDICDRGVDEYAITEAFRWLHWVDETFSTYRTDSAISRLNRCEIGLADAHPAVARVLRRCEELRVETTGYFDVRAPYAPGGRGPDAGRGGPGSVDPSGLVKGWAIAEAARMLARAGAENFIVNAGGDIYVAGHPPGETAWRVGIQHPRIAKAVALTLAVTDRAVATSGTYVRGDHIADPHGGRGPATLQSVTITGPQLPTADAYATAVYAMGADRGAAWCMRLRGYDAILIRDDDTVLSTPGIELLRASELNVVT